MKLLLDPRASPLLCSALFREATDGWRAVFIMCDEEEGSGRLVPSGTEVSSKALVLLVYVSPCDAEEVGLSLLRAKAMDVLETRRRPLKSVRFAGVPTLRDEKSGEQQFLRDYGHLFRFPYLRDERGLFSLARLRNIDDRTREFAARNPIVQGTSLSLFSLPRTEAGKYFGGLRHSTVHTLLFCVDPDRTSALFLYDPSDGLVDRMVHGVAQMFCPRGLNYVVQKPLPRHLVDYPKASLEDWKRKTWDYMCSLSVC